MNHMLLAEAPASAAPQEAGVAGEAKKVYFSLYADPASMPEQAQDFLREQIAVASRLPADLPASIHELPAWIEQRTDAVGAQYRDYLAARKAGAPRRYFHCRSHALYFIKGAAPTKLVDGAWLYGLLRQWDNQAYHHLIKTYLEELGEGVPDKNHVTIYRKLLATHGCEDWEQLDDEHFLQGAIQLVLGHHADRFLPEVIGYNLGYEQLPLHLLITSYELNELGIDPYYFTLHVTVDNAASGHARKAAQALADLMPRVGDREAFYRRVLDGYRLNDLGASTISVISEFDLQAELVSILAAKSKVGKNMHSDYCRVAGRSVNDWLAEPGRIPDFLAALEKAGWIKRGEDPENSRFWRLIHGERAEMFGVFNAYEQQVLRDWIMSSPDAGAGRNMAAAPRVLTHRARQRTLDTLGQHAERGIAFPERGLIRRHPRLEEPDNELRLLEQQVAAASGKQEAMDLLAGLMSPEVHHTAAGLMATRMYTQLFDA
ncbi:MULTISPECIES: iron-containing redox enzyme family protein [unclassified Massilia]|uniref:iron-containing redox enzyme family protein n=1 Tax=unclassified Massilia TaxID=2609279 RepID=UPI001B81CC9A|nr:MULTISPECIES: iron-containing redox enzyme family protein [unclassified Massilia]MBQ5938486.1 iron-containing redox enzyme family protein [Massilia sp. AB1]MBQ5963207.1 iron-containing redox enzyme family protein [Massilia sp. ZL223]